MLYTHIMEYYPALRRKEALTRYTTWMNLENILLSEKKPDRKDYILHDLIYI